MTSKYEFNAFNQKESAQACRLRIKENQKSNKNKEKISRKKQLAVLSAQNKKKAKQRAMIE